MRIGRLGGYTLFSFLILMMSLLVDCGGSGAPEPEAEPAASEETPAAVEPAEEEPESAPEEEAEASDIIYPVVEMATSAGVIRLELYPEKAPVTVENFLTYVRDGFYDGTIFHRVVPGFVIQGGGFTPDMTQKDTRPPIQNEADNGLKNDRGTICMARTPDPNSATSQFFINTKDNPALDFRDRSTRGWGYAVFGKVIQGMDVVDAIEKVPRTRKSGYDDVPEEPVIIESARIVAP